MELSMLFVGIYLYSLIGMIYDYVFGNSLIQIGFLSFRPNLSITC